MSKPVATSSNPSEQEPPEQEPPEEKLLLTNDSKKNMEVLSKLVPRNPIPHVATNIFDEQQFKGINKRGRKWFANITLDMTTYPLGSYHNEIDAAIAYSTAYDHFVTKQKLDNVAIKVMENKDKVSSDAGTEDKYTNERFFNEGREHHVYNKIPIMEYETHYSQDDCDRMHKEMDRRIEACSELAKEEFRRIYLGRRKSVHFKDILTPALSERVFFRQITSVEELEAMVKEVTDKELGFFTDMENIRPSDDFPSRTDYLTYFRKLRLDVGRRIIYYLGVCCYYCGKEINPDDPKKWWAYCMEHLSIHGKKDVDPSKASGAEEVLVELNKGVSCCNLCNPVGDDERSFPIDRFYSKVLLVPDAELGEYREIEAVFALPEFDKFVRVARDNMNMDYTREVDENGNWLSGNGRSATFLEFKLLVWDCFGILLEDIVLWRKINDYASPRYAFRSTVWTLIKVLTNRCPGTIDELNGVQECTGWRNLRNLLPWQYSGIHFDHGRGAGCQAQKVWDFITCNWEVFVEQTKRCKVLCAECHKGE
jgi:hypothetical protein